MRETALAFTCVLAIGCGDDKGYDDPIEIEFVGPAATSAITNAGGITNMEGDAPIAALNVLSANLTQLVNAKFQHLNSDGQSSTQSTQRIETSEYNALDEACFTQTDSEITYDSCETQGLVVDGTVSVSDDSVEVHLDMSISQPEQNFSSEVSIDGDIEVTVSAIDGYLDFHTSVETEDVTATVELDSDFDVELVDGCAVGGKIEVHALAVSKTDGYRAKVDLWVKAEFGPACGDVAVY